MIQIYVLIDPRTNEVKYIGKTKQPINRRFRHHIHRGRRFPNMNRVSSWIANVLADGLIPEIFIIEKVDPKIWEDSERFWIAYFRFIGSNLTNMTDGGEINDGRKPSLETRAKLSMAAKKQFENSNAREISRQAALAAWADPNYRDKQAKRIVTDEYLILQSKIKLELCKSDEYRAKLRAGQARVPRSDIAKLFWQRPEYQQRHKKARERRKARGWNNSVGE